MDAIIRGTTPTLRMNIKSDIDMSMIAEVWIYISQQNKVKVDKTIVDMTIDAEHKRVFAPLTQNDTLGLKAGTAFLQSRILLNDGTALGIAEIEIDILPIGKEGVIKHE